MYYINYLFKGVELYYMALEKLTMGITLTTR